MPKSKKQKTSHHSNNQPYLTRKNHQTNHDRNAALSHEEIWDDSALLRSWDDAVREYEFYHSIHARGEDVDEVLRQAEAAEQSTHHLKQSTAPHDRNSSSEEDDEDEDGEISSNHDVLEETPDEKRFKEQYAATLALLNEKAPKPDPDTTSKAQFSFLSRWMDDEDPMGYGDKNNRETDRDARSQAIRYWLEEGDGKVVRENETEDNRRVVREMMQTTNATVESTETGMASGEAVNGTVNAPTTAADQTLENIKMAYYWAGYYSGLYDGQRQGQGQSQGEGQKQ